MTIGLPDVLERSNVTPEFRAAVRQFLKDRRDNPRIRFDAGCPNVKVERLLVQALQAYPDLSIDSVAVEARSGCEFFRGDLRIEADGDTRQVRFEWNCRWRAEEMGWTDAFGFADQARAAREFGHDCFREWEEIAPASV